MRSALREWSGPALLIAFVSVLTYGASLSNDFVLFDDDYLVTANSAVHMITPGSIAFVFTHFDPELYIPLTFLSYQIDHAVGGLDPFVFHKTNLILHILNAILVMSLLFLLLRDRWMAIACGLIFAVHPLHTETVAWVSARKDLLSTFFFLTALCSFLRFRDTDQRAWHRVSIALYALGLLAKVQILTLPLILLVLDWRERRPLKESLRTALPFFILSILFGIIALFGKETALQESSLLEKILMAGKSTLIALWHFVWPAHLSVLYPQTEAISLVRAEFFVPMLLLITTGALLLWSLRSGRMMMTGAAFFFVTLAPTFLNAAKAGDVYFSSDRYVYMPSIGILFLLTLALRRWNRLITGMAGAAVILLLAWRANVQAAVWADTETLFRHVLSAYPDAHIAHTKIGAMQAERGEVAEAEAAYERSLAIRPNERAYYNLGVIYLSRGEAAKALDVNLKAIALNPAYAPARVNAGYLEWERENQADAVAHFEVAVEHDPFAIDARLNLAGIYIAMGRKEDARPLLSDVLAIDPQNADARALWMKL